MQGWIHTQGSKKPASSTGLPLHHSGSQKQLQFTLSYRRTANMEFLLSYRNKIFILSLLSVTHSLGKWKVAAFVPLETQIPFGVPAGRIPVQHPELPAVTTCDTEAARSSHMFHMIPHDPTCSYMFPHDPTCLKFWILNLCAAKREPL